MTVTKASTADSLVDTVGLNRREAKEIIETFFGSILETLVSGEEVKLPGFGNFTLRDKRARPERNPKNGEPMPITARRVVIFHAIAILRDTVTQNWQPLAESENPDSLWRLRVMANRGSF